MRAAAWFGGPGAEARRACRRVCSRQAREARRRTTGWLRGAAALLLASGLALPAPAWNAVGHRIVAAIAYERLTPSARARVDEILRHHPDYDALLAKDAPADSTGRAREAFLAAATWPDLIRNDPRFYDETRKGAVAPPLLSGFPDMGRHPAWHYYDTPYTPDGARAPRPRPPSALSELRRLLRAIPTAAPAEQAYDLAWIEHLVGDVHQPLHSTSRFLRSQPKGDAGGNFVYITPGTNLHALWDNLPGTDAGDKHVNRYARDAVVEVPAPGRLSLDPRRWIEESFRFARRNVYTFGPVTGSKEHPLALPAGYEENAKRIARQRIALAGYRLAAVLNARFR
jgi:hypothetical protein